MKLLNTLLPHPASGLSLPGCHGAFFVLLRQNCCPWTRMRVLLLVVISFLQKCSLYKMLNSLILMFIRPQQRDVNQIVQVCVLYNINYFFEV